MPKLRVHDHTHSELTDVLAPPTFAATGEVKTVKQAAIDGNWVGSINIWLYTREPEPSIIYQLRSPHALWEPNKLDMAAAGHYRAGEQGVDGMHELREELGVKMPKKQLEFFGRKLNVGMDVKGLERKWCMTVYLAEYTGTLEDMKLQKHEVFGVFRVPLKPLMEVFAGKRASFTVQGLDADKQPLDYTVTATSFPYNFDDYQRRMAEFIALKLGVSNAYLGH
jgi:hypothetical protein